MRRGAALAERTTMRIGGKAEFLVEPSDEEGFAAAYAAAARQGRPVHVLGGGSNLLVADEGVPGVVISTRRMADRHARVEGGRVFARAGTPLARLVNWAVGKGLAGLECLVGIPGTVGGAVWMNAGGRDGNIGPMVRKVTCVNEEGRLISLDAASLSWGYRRSGLTLPVVAVELELKADAPSAVAARTTETLERKLRGQPMDVASAGCFFRNPPGDNAGRLIEAAGLKGCRIGGAEVSSRHANFLVNTGAAAAADVLALAEHVRGTVRSRFGIVLENEVCIWP